MRHRTLYDDATGLWLVIDALRGAATVSVHETEQEAVNAAWQAEERWVRARPGVPNRAGVRRAA